MLWVLRLIQGILGYRILAFFFFFFFKGILGLFFFFFFFFLYGIFRNFGIWDIGIYFGIQVKLILGCGTNQASVLTCDFTIKVEFVSTLWYHKKNFLVCVTLTPVEIRK